MHNIWRWETLLNLSLWWYQKSIALSPVTLGFLGWWVHKITGTTGIAYLVCSPCSHYQLTASASGSGTCPQEKSFCSRGCNASSDGWREMPCTTHTVSVTCESQEGTKSRVLTAVAIIRVASASGTVGHLGCSGWPQPVQVWQLTPNFPWMNQVQPQCLRRNSWNRSEQRSSPGSCYILQNSWTHWQNCKFWSCC